MRHSILVFTLTVFVGVGTTASAQVDLMGTPSDGEHTIASGFTPDPQTFSLQVDGEVNASTVDDGCSGWIGSTPDIRIHYTSGVFPLRLYLDEERANTSLCVNTPDASWHGSDDAVGRNPVVDFENPQTGQYDIFVGARRRGRTPTVTLYVTELPSMYGPTAEEGEGTGQGPRQRSRIQGRQVVTDGLTRSGPTPSPGATDPSGTLVATNETEGLGGNLHNGDPVYGRFDVNSGFDPDPASVSLSSGGPLQASASIAACEAGWINTLPDVVVNYTASSLPLRFYVQPTSDGDTSLVIHAPDDTWYCVNDSIGLNPVIDFPNPQSGEYAIFVGSIQLGQFHGIELHWTELPDTFGPSE